MAFANPENIIKQLQIPAGATVADFGAGAGHFSIPLAKAVGEAGKVYAVDVQKDILSRLQNVANREYHVRNIETVWGDIDEAGGAELRDGIADFIFMTNVLFLLDDIPAAIAEAHRVLKRSGQLVVVEWSDSFGGLGPEAGRIIPETRAKEMLTAAGFACEPISAPGEHHYGFVCSKTTA